MLRAQAKVLQCRRLSHQRLNLDTPGVGVLLLHDKVVVKYL